MKQTCRFQKLPFVYLVLEKRLNGVIIDAFTVFDCQMGQRRMGSGEFDEESRGRFGHKVERNIFESGIHLRTQTS